MDKIQYYKYLKDEIIEYRDSLNIPKNITFGIEIEYEQAIKDYIDYYIYEKKHDDKNYGNWVSCVEIDTLSYDKDDNELGGEVKSPILTDSIQTWKNLEWTLDLIKNNNGLVTHKCGGHINIGAQIFGERAEYYKNFFLLWILYEKEITKFCSGEFNAIRKCNSVKRLGPLLNTGVNRILTGAETTFPYIMHITDCILDKKHYFSLNKVESYAYKNDNVIEFRLPNGTLDKAIWQNYINFFTKFLLTCKKSLDEEKILYKIQKKDSNLIELADLVFKKDIDKENFLIQSLKTNKIYNQHFPTFTH